MGRAMWQSELDRLKTSHGRERGARMALNVAKLPELLLKGGALIYRLKSYREVSLALIEDAALSCLRP